MAEPTNSDLQAQIRDLKDYVMSGPMVKLKDNTEVLSKLVTEKFLTDQLAPLVQDVKDIHKEVVKKMRVELLEASGFDGFGAAAKKLYEDGWGVAWKYFAAAFSGILIPLALAALLISVTGLFTTLQRTIQAAIFGGKIYARNADGQIRKQVKTDVEARERRVAGGDWLSSLPNAAALEPLRAKLEIVNPLVQKFNEEAGKWPKAREIAATATAMEKLGRAVGGVDNAVVLATAKAIRNLKGALKNFDHTKIPRDHAVLSKTATALKNLDTAFRRLNNTTIEASATAIGKLKDSFHNFSPATVRDTATATRTLGSETRTLETRFAGLRAEAGRLAAVVG